LYPVHVRRRIAACRIAAFAAVLRFRALLRAAGSRLRGEEAVRETRAWKLALLLGLLLLAAVGSSVTSAAVSPPSPGGFADGAFCTYGKGYFSNSTEAAQRIQGSV
jgi:hypothetical protein